MRVGGRGRVVEEGGVLRLGVLRVTLRRRYGLVGGGDALRHLVGLGLEHEVGLLIEAQVRDVRLVGLAFGLHLAVGAGLHEGVLLRPLAVPLAQDPVLLGEQVVLDGLEQVVELGALLLLDLHELVAAVRVVVPVLTVMLLGGVLVALGRCGGFFDDDRLGDLLRGDQRERLLFFTYLWWLHEGWLLGLGSLLSLLAAELDGLLNKLVEHLALLGRVRPLLLLVNVGFRLGLVAERGLEGVLARVS